MANLPGSKDQERGKIEKLPEVGGRRLIKSGGTAPGTDSEINIGVCAGGALWQAERNAMMTHTRKIAPSFILMGGNLLIGQISRKSDWNCGCDDAGNGAKQEVI